MHILVSYFYVEGANPGEETEYWVNVTKDMKPGNDILWNNQQLDWRFESESDIITTHDAKDESRSYYNGLPSYLISLLPLPGTNEMTNDEENILFLPKMSQVYMIKQKDGGNEEIDSWTHTGDVGQFLGQNNSDVFIVYKKIMKPGTYQFYHPNALYLFVEGKCK